MEARFGMKGWHLKHYLSAKKAVKEEASNLDYCIEDMDKKIL